MELIEEIKKDYILKGISVPEYYLGSNIKDLDAVRNKHGISTALLAETYI